MSVKNTLEVKINDQDRTLLSYIKAHYENLPLSVIHQLFRKKEIKVNSKPVTKPQYFLQDKDVITIFLPDKFAENKTVEKKWVSKEQALSKFKIIYEDKNLLVVDKPANLNVEGSTNSLDYFVRSYLIDSKNFDLSTSNIFLPSHINRIDKKTFGIVLYAKNYAFLTYINQVYGNKEHVDKKYLAVVEGLINKPQLLEGHLSEDENGFVRFNTHKQGKFSSMQITPLKRANDLTLIEVKLFTGRKNQIRATMAFYKHYICGDDKYHPFVKNSKEMMLLHYQLFFKNLTGEYEYLNKMLFKADLPLSFELFLKKNKIKFIY